jgi:hypothetical protein
MLDHVDERDEIEVPQKGSLVEVGAICFKPARRRPGDSSGRDVDAHGDGSVQLAEAFDEEACVAPDVEVTRTCRIELRPASMEFRSHQTATLVGASDVRTATFEVRMMRVLFGVVKAGKLRRRGPGQRGEAVTRSAAMKRE